MAQSAANCRNTLTVKCRNGSHAFTRTLYINTVTTTWCEAPAELLLSSACWVFSCLHNPPNSDMDCRIFSRAYMTILVRACTHRGWAYRRRVSTTFFWENSQFFLVLLTGFEPSTFGPDALPFESPRYSISEILLWRLAPVMSHAATPPYASNGQNVDPVHGMFGTGRRRKCTGIML